VIFLQILQVVRTNGKTEIYLVRFASKYKYGFTVDLGRIYVTKFASIESLKSRESQVKGLHVDGELEIHTSC